MKIGTVAKGIVAIIGAVASLAVAATTDNSVTNAEVGTIIAAGLTALAVYIVPNTTPNTAAKK